MWFQGRFFFFFEKIGDWRIHENVYSFAYYFLFSTRTNFEKAKGNGKSSPSSSSSSSSSTSSTKVPGPMRKHTSSLLQTNLNDESMIASNNRDSSSSGGMYLPTESHEVKEVAVSRVSCHRCGNIRKNKLQCTRNMVKLMCSPNPTCNHHFFSFFFCVLIFFFPMMTVSVHFLWQMCGKDAGRTWSKCI